MPSAQWRRLQINKISHVRAFYVSGLGSHNFARLLTFQYFMDWSVKNFASAKECTEQLQSLAARTSDEITRFFAGFTAGSFSDISSDYFSARDHFEQALNLSDDARDVLIKGLDTAVSFVNCTGALGLELWMLGYADQARKQYERMLHVVSGPIDAYARGLGMVIELQMSDFLRDNRRMLEAGERLVALARESGTMLLGAGMIWLGRGREVEGAVDRGIEAVAEGRDILLKLGELALLDALEHTAAAAYLAAGKTEEGLAAVEGRIEKCAEGNVGLEADLHRLKGELLLAADAPTTDAEDSFRKAITIAQRQQAKSWELRATLSLTRLLMKQGRRDEARTMLAEIYNWFTEGFDTADLKDAKALLDELSA
jgi:predicted ATPase